MTVQLPFEQAHPLEVAPLLRQLQCDGVVHRVRTTVGDRAWLVTGYEEVRRLLADERLARSHPDPARAARLGAMQNRKTLPESALAAAVVAVAARGGWQRPSRAGLA
jgi:hypothetical protein